MGAVLEALLSKVTLTPGGSEKLRTFAVYNGKLIKEYGPQDPISVVHDSLNLYVEEIPTEEYDRKDEEQIIPCFHYTGDVSRLHGIPFRMVIKEVRN